LSLSSGVDFRNGNVRIPHPRFIPGMAGRSTLRIRTVTVRKVRKRRPWAHLQPKTSTNSETGDGRVTPFCTFSNDRMAGVETPLCATPLTHRDIRDFTLRLSNLSVLSVPGDGVTLRREAYILSHLWAQGDLYAPHICY